MILPEFPVEKLRTLPLRAIVALAARMARRVEPLAALPEGHAGCESRRSAFEAAVRAAEDFARGVDRPDSDQIARDADASRGVDGEAPSSDAAMASAAMAAHCAVAARGAMENTGRVISRHLWERSHEARAALQQMAGNAADFAALCAHTSGAEAFYAIGIHNEAFVAALLGDYRRLVELRLGTFPEPGSAVDPSPDGPLGPY
jgi:hypothetical protein